MTTIDSSRSGSTGFCQRAALSSARPRLDADAVARTRQAYRSSTNKQFRLGSVRWI